MSNSVDAMNWGNTQEAVFIRNIGKFSECRMSKEQLLKNYQLAIQKRYHWGNIDPGFVAQQIANQL